MWSLIQLIISIINKVQNLDLSAEISVNDFGSLNNEEMKIIFEDGHKEEDEQTFQSKSNKLK